MREWAYLHSGLEWIYDHEVPAAYRTRTVNKVRVGYWAWFIRQGQVRVVTAQGKSYKAGPGQWLFVPTGELRQHFSDDARILSLHFLCQWPSGENILSGSSGMVIAGKTHPDLEKKAVLLERMVRRYIPHADTRYYSCFSDYEHFLTFHTLFLQWLGVWFKVQKENGSGLARLSADDDRLLRAFRCLNNAPLNEGLPHETLQRESGLSEAHLNRLFLKEYGLTLQKSWEQRRLNFARTCLETSTTPVKEIAYGLGFKSDSHFMMWFKQRTGKRPKEYRQIHRLLPI
jgi:AraC-like DNA-binding protein